MLSPQTRYSSYFAALALLLCTTAQATLLVTSAQTGSGNNTFTAPVGAKVYDRARGMLYLGAGQSLISEAFALSAIPRFNGTGTLHATPFATNALVQNAAFDFLALAATEGDANPKLVMVKKNSNSADPLTQTKVIAATLPYKLTDAVFKELPTDLLTFDGNTTGGIVGVAASKDFIFAALKPFSFAPITAFGGPGSSIALVTISPGNNQCSPESSIFEIKQTGIQPGGSAQLGFQLDNNNFGVIDTTTPENSNKVAMHWDDRLQRLFIGLRQTASTGGSAVIVGRVQAPSSLILEPISTVVSNDTIVTGTSDSAITIKHLRTMHTSTGATYLIVNGGNGTVDQVGNAIQAVPLVDVNDQTASDANQGKLADITQTPAVNGAFTTLAGALFTQGAPQSTVGSSPLPLSPAGSIADMDVVGDTVYIALNNAPDSTNSSGIFSSQAQFDNLGRIIGWTPWTQRAFTFPGFGNAVPKTGSIAYLAVDAVNGKIWAVEGLMKMIVATTAWDVGGNITQLNGKVTPSLTKQLNTALVNNNDCTQGCYALLDLPHQTRGFFSETPYGAFYDSALTNTNTYALFGGIDTVIFARTGISASSALECPQTVITDFSFTNSCNKTIGTNFLVSKLPQGAGAVTTLEYARRTSGEGASNYFFAGTNNGLYVFANNDANGSGFLNTDLTTVNIAPLSTGTWQKAANIPGAVIDLATSGRSLYILTSQPGNLSIVYRVDFAPTRTAMFAAVPFEIGRAGSGNLAGIQTITGLRIIEVVDSVTGFSNNTEQLVLSTNNGAYISAPNVQTATNDATANWSLVATTTNNFYYGITSAPALFPTTVWPFGVSTSSSCPGNNRGTVDQITTSTALSALHPADFVTEQPCGTATLDKVRGFWSDGARRFFIVNPKNSSSGNSKLVVLPFNTKEWHLTQAFPLTDPALYNVTNFNWIAPVGPQGILLVGTNKGVIALE